MSDAARAKAQEIFHACNHRLNAPGPCRECVESALDAFAAEQTAALAQRCEALANRVVDVEMLHLADEQTVRNLEGRMAGLQQALKDEHHTAVMHRLLPDIADDWLKAHKESPCDICALLFKPDKHGQYTMPRSPWYERAMKAEAERDAIKQAFIKRDGEYKDLLAALERRMGETLVSSCGFCRDTARRIEALVEHARQSTHP